MFHLAMVLEKGNFVDGSLQPQHPAELSYDLRLAQAMFDAGAFESVEYSTCIRHQVPGSTGRRSSREHDAGDRARIHQRALRRWKLSMRVNAWPAMAKPMRLAPSCLASQLWPFK
jgi:hypothetical protein